MNRVPAKLGRAGLEERARLEAKLQAARVALEHSEKQRIRHQADADAAERARCAAEQRAAEAEAELAVEQAATRVGAPATSRADGADARPPAAATTLPASEAALSYPATTLLDKSGWTPPWPLRHRWRLAEADKPACVGWRCAPTRHQNFHVS